MFPAQPRAEVTVPLIRALLLLLALLGLPARAEERPAVAVMREALEAEAPLPQAPARLPDSEQGTARPPAGKGSGEAGGKRVEEAAERARDQEVNRAAQGAAASAAKSANADAKAAAAQGRTNGARGSGSSHGHGPPTHP
jgi:hypothetical protein